MKQTSVEWLVGQLEKHYVSQDIKNTAVFMQAKEMEKEQIVNAFYQGADKESDSHGHMYLGKDDAEQYYNETFNTNEK